MPSVAKRKPKKPAAKSTSTNHLAREPIKRGEVYPLNLFLDLTGIGSRGLREARDKGLRVVYQGRTAFVAGDDWADFIAGAERRTERW